MLVSDISYPLLTFPLWFCSAAILGTKVRKILSFHSFDAIVESFPAVLQSWVAVYFDCRPSIKVPARMTSYILLLVKWMHEKLGFRKYNHSVSVHYVQLASRSRTFNCTASQKHIGYSPVVSLEVSVFVKSHSFMYFPLHLLFFIICYFPLTCLSFVYIIIGLSISL